MTVYRTKARLLDTVMSRLPGVTAPVVELELKNTLNEFFTRSTVWRDRLVMNIVEGIDEYEMVPNDAVSKILHILYADISEVPFRYHILQPRTIVLKDTPTRDLVNALNIVVTLTLDDSVCEDEDCDSFIPDFIYDYFFEAVLDGVLGRFYSIASRPWSNAQLAVLHQTRFRQGWAQARVQANASYTRGFAPWRFPRSFAGVSSQRTRVR